MALTGPMSVGVIDRSRTPRPSRTIASSGRAAISPQIDRATPASRQRSTSSRMKLSTGGESTS